MDVVKPGGRQYTLKRGKVLVEAIAAGIEPLEFHRKVQREMRFNLAVHNPDALFNIIHQQRRDQAVNEANDHAHRQTAKRRDSRSVAAAETKLQGNAADKHDKSQSAKTAGVKAEWNRRYEHNECFCLRQVKSQAMGLAPKPAEQGGEWRSWPEPRPGSKQQQPQQQHQSTSGPAQQTGRKATGAAPASATPTAGASGYKTASKAVVTGTEPAAPAASTQKDDDYVYIRVPREKVAPVDSGCTETV